MEALRLSEVNSILASMVDTEPEKIVGWVLVVAVDNGDDTEGILTASPANVDGIPENEARVANIVALAWALHTLSNGYMQMQYPDYPAHVAELTEFVCEPCKQGNHFFCTGKCDCQHRGESWE